MHVMTARDWVRFAVLALTLATGPDASAGSGRFDVTKFGVKADGKTDNSAALQRIVDALTGPSTLDFPPGEYRFRLPVYVDKPSVHIKGSGRGVTTFKTVDVDAPPLVFGLRQVEKNGQKVTEAHRPDVFGLLDASIAPAKGVFRGFSTRGNAYAIANANPAQVGQVAPTLTGGLRHYDYYGAMTGLTVETALRLPSGMNTFFKESKLLGMGSGYDPGPWYFGVDAAKEFLFSFRTSEQPIDPGLPRHTFRFKMPSGVRGPVYRVRLWLDFETGAAGAAVNGVNAAIKWTGTPPPLKGARLAKNRGQYPFFIGPSPGFYVTSLDCGPVPAFDILAFRVSRVGRKTEPKNDLDRYGDHPDAVVFLSGKGPAARHMILGCGRATASPGCVAFILNTGGSDGGIIANSVSDLTIWGGGQSIALGGILDFTVSDCEFSDGFVGVGSIPLGMNYPILMRNLRTAGWDAGISLSRAFVRLYAVDIGGGGICSARFIGCTVGWYSGLVQFFNPEGECCLDFIGDEAGGAFTILDFYADNEGAAFADAVVRIDNHPYGPVTSFYARNLSAALVGEKGTVLHLRGKPADKHLGTVDVAGLIYGDPKTKSAVRVSGPWKGRIDLRGLSNQRIEGEPGPGLEILRDAVKP